MKKNLFFDVGKTLLYPTTGNCFITPNFFNILGNIDKKEVEKAIEKNIFLLDERNIYTEIEEMEMFKKFYLKILKDLNYKNITEKIIHDLAYDCVYNDEKFSFYDDVKEEITKLSKKYDLYIISNAWPSTNRVLKNYGIYNLFKKVYISSELGFKKEDEKLFEIALEDVSEEDENYFIDDRRQLLVIAKNCGFIPIIIDRDKNIESEFIEIEELKDIENIFKYYD